MAKGDVVLKFSGDSQEVVQELAKMRAEMAKLSAASEASGKKFSDFGSTVASSAKSAVRELIGVTSAASAAAAAVGLMKQALLNYYNEQKEHGDAYLSRVGPVNNALAGAGQTASGTMVKAAIAKMAGQSMGNRQYNQTEISAAFAGISNAVGAKLSPDQVLGATQFELRAQSQLGLLSGDKGEPNPTTGALGINYANFLNQRNRGGFKGSTDQQLQDMAYWATVGAKGEPLDERTLRFLSEAPDKNQAVQLIIAAGLSDESGKTLNTLLTESGGNAKRFNSLLKNPSREEKVAVTNLMQAASAVKLGPMPTATRDDAVEAAQAAITAKLGNTESKGDVAAQLQALHDLRGEYFELQHPTQSLIPGFKKAAGYFSGGNDADMELESEMGQRMYKWKPKVNPDDESVNEQIEVLRALLQYQQTGTMHLQSINRTLAANPALSNKQDGQK